MKTLSAILTSVALAAASHGADAQSAPENELDSKLKACAMEVIDENAPKGAVKSFGASALVKGARTYNFKYREGNGQIIQESHIMIRSGKIGYDTLSVKVNMGFASPNIAINKFDDASVAVSMDKSRLDLPYRIYPGYSSDQVKSYQIQAINQHAQKLAKGMLECMSPKIG